ncbi:tetratricopeptide repeat protein [bacterium]|nr:tetratricopeptide repeat protein [bacterium]
MALKIVKANAIAPKREDLIEMGARAFTQGDFETAATHFLAALEQGEQDAPLFTQLGVALLQQGKYDKAVVALRQALVIDPYLVDALNALGVTMFKLDWYAAAEVFFRRVLELNPSHPAARQSLVEAIRMVRETGDAVVPDLEYLVALTRPTEPTLSLCMIVKNEERFLEGCLQSVRGVVDEIVLVDTGSTDQTVAIAERYGAKIHQHAWDGDFATARNVSIEHATGDWVLVLDADERLDPETVVQLKSALRRKDVAGYALAIENRLGTDDDLTINQAVIFRLFPRRSDIRFEGIVHEQASLSAQRTGLPTLFCPAKIIHLGYMNEVMTGRNKLERNLTLLQRQAELQPDFPYVYFNLGQTYKMMDREEEAEANFLLALDKLKATKSEHGIPYYSTLYFSLADLYRKQKRYDEVHRLLDEGLEHYETFPDLHFTKGLAYLAKERYAEAMPHFERCISLRNTIHAGGTDRDVTGYKAHNALGVCYAKLGDRPKAKHHLKEALSFHSASEAELHNNLGILHMEDGEAGEAIVQFVAALEKNPDDLRSWVNLANVSYRCGQYAEAIQAWSKALELDANLPQLRTLMAEAHLKLGQPQEAIALLEAELEQAPDSQAGWLNLGLARLCGGDTSGARAAWGHIPADGENRAFPALFAILDGAPIPADLPVAEETVRAWGVVTDLAIASEQLALIQALLDRIDEIGEQVPGFEAGLAQVFMKRGLADLAVGALLRAQRRTPEDPDVYRALGEACLAQGNHEDAEVMFARADELIASGVLTRRLATLGAS